MGKKAKERKQTQVSPDYISASAGNSGILRDMAGHFAGTGRYVVPTITAACAMQGTVMPVCQVQAAAVAVAPADNVTIEASETMTIPDSGVTTVTSVTACNSANIFVLSGGVANNTTLSKGAALSVDSGGRANDTVIDAGRMYVSSGGEANRVTTVDASLSGGGYGYIYVSSGGVVNDVLLNNSCNQLIVRGGEATAVNISGGSASLTSGAIITDSFVNNKSENNRGNLKILSGSVAKNVTVNAGYFTTSESVANDTKVNSGYFTASNGVANNTIVNGGIMRVIGDSAGNAVAMNTTLKGGVMEVSAGGIATDTIVDLDATMKVVSGSASSTIVSGGGSMTVSSGGVATSTTLGGTIIGAQVLPGRMLVYGGSASDTEINNGGAMVLLDSATATSTTVNSGGSLDFSNGTGAGKFVSATSTVVNSGGSMSVCLGTATNTVVNGGMLNVSFSGGVKDTIVDNGGTMIVGGATGAASNTLINSGSMQVLGSGHVDLTTINSGGNMVVSGGVASNTTISGGSLLVSNGGAVSITVDNGGSVTVMGGSNFWEAGGLRDITVNVGTVTVSSGGQARSATINNAGRMEVIGGSASSTTINGGSLFISSGSRVSSTTVTNSGVMVVSSGGKAVETIIDLDSTMMVVGGSASKTEINSGSMIVSSGGVASVTKVNSGGSMTVSSGGTAISTTISGGSVTINAGSATNTNISSGNMNLLSGGMATDTTVHSGGVLSVTGSSTVNNVVLSGGVFTNSVAGTTALISGTVTGDGDITGPGDFTIANGNILLNSGEVSTTGKLTIDKVLDTTKPAVSATTLDVGSVDVTDMNVGFSNSGTLIETATPLTSLTLVSATSQTDLSNVNSSVTIDGGMRINKSIPGVTVEYSTPPVTYSLVNNAQQIDYSINGNKQATRLTFGSIGWLDTGALIDHTNQFDDVIFSGATVDTSAIHFNNVASMEANKTMTLVSDFGTSVGKIIGTKYTVGTTLQGNGKAELVGNDLVYKVETASNEVQEQTHNTLMGMEAGLATINSGQEFIEKAVDGFGDINNTGNDGIAVYAGMGVGKDRYETGSHININTWNGIVGVGKSHQLENGKFQWGGFVEHGSGKFTTYNAGQQGDGSTDYTGGGVAAKWTNKHDVYTEVGLRYGRAHDSASNMLRDALGNSYGYNVHADYYGGYFGLGKIYRFGTDRSLDVYGKFYSTHRDGVSFDTGGHYDLDSLQSNILRVGAKYRAKAGKVNWYGGLAYEHEFGGEATGRADGVPIRAASIKGGSLRADLGISLKASEDSPWTMDLGITGHTGKHRGVGGRIFIGCKF